MSRHQADDAVGQFVAQWRASRLDLDPAPTEVIGRITRLARIFQRRADGWLAEFDLTWETFAVLGALLRQGPPYRLTPTALYRQALLTSGAITNRIARAAMFHRGLHRNRYRRPYDLRRRRCHCQVRRRR